jgi:alpha-tubulin suppressor-like RCC1 family protein
MALKTDGTIWSWGSNSYGQLGLGDTTKRSSPVQVGALTTWSKIYAGYGSGAGIKTDGTMWSWGNNGSGRLGLGNTTSVSSPVQIGALTTWANASFGEIHAFALLPS